MCLKEMLADFKSDSLKIEYKCFLFINRNFHYFSVNLELY